MVSSVLRGLLFPLLIHSYFCTRPVRVASWDSRDSAGPFGVVTLAHRFGRIHAPSRNMRSALRFLSDRNPGRLLVEARIFLFGFTPLGQWSPRPPSASGKGSACASLPLSWQKPTAGFLFHWLLPGSARLAVGISPWKCMFVVKQPVFLRSGFVSFFCRFSLKFQWLQQKVQ